MGCTDRAGLTGVSTLAIGSILVFFSIVDGAAVTMKVSVLAHDAGGVIAVPLTAIPRFRLTAAHR